MCWRNTAARCTFLLQPPSRFFPETERSRKRRRSGSGHGGPSGKPDKLQDRALGGRSARQRLSGRCRPHFPLRVQRNRRLRPKEARKGCRRSSLRLQTDRRPEKFASFGIRKGRPFEVRFGNQPSRPSGGVRSEGRPKGTRRSSLRRGTLGTWKELRLRKGTRKGTDRGRKASAGTRSGNDAAPSPARRTDRGQWGLAAMSAPIGVLGDARDAAPLAHFRDDHSASPRKRGSSPTRSGS